MCHVTVKSFKHIETLDVVLTSETSPYILIYPFPLELFYSCIAERQKCYCERVVKLHFRNYVIYVNDYYGINYEHKTQYIAFPYRHGSHFKMPILILLNFDVFRCVRSVLLVVIVLSRCSKFLVGKASSDLQVSSGMTHVAQIS